MKAEARSVAEVNRQRNELAAKLADMEKKLKEGACACCESVRVCMCVWVCCYMRKWRREVWRRELKELASKLSRN